MVDRKPSGGSPAIGSKLTAATEPLAGRALALTAKDAAATMATASAWIKRNVTCSWLAPVLDTAPRALGGPTPPGAIIPALQNWPAEAATTMERVDRRNEAHGRQAALQPCTTHPPHNEATVRAHKCNRSTTVRLPMLLLTAEPQ